MIVRQFLRWIRTAPAGERAEATHALARAYLVSDLSERDRRAAERAMTLMLDDPSPLVRRTLAEVLGPSRNAPPTVIQALAADQSDIAAIVLSRSPLFIDAELVDLVATGDTVLQAAIARRAPLQCPVAAAIAEVGTAEACLVMLENPAAGIAPLSFTRIAERHGDLGAIREAMFARYDLPAATRQALVSALSRVLADFVAGRRWLDSDRAHRIAREACERATVALAAGSDPSEARPLVRHLRISGQLTAGLILRALLCGNVMLFEEALADLAELPLGRVRGLLNDRNGASFRAVFDRAGLPPSSYPAFRIAIEALQESPHEGTTDRLRRRMVERVLTGCERADVGELDPLLTLLRRFASEAAREEARDYCDELCAEDILDYDEMGRSRIAA